MNASVRCVIVGAGLAGHRAAVELRRLSPEASITLLGEEAGLPYDRPPLSKAFLARSASAGQILLKDADRYDDLGIVHRPLTVVRKVDRVDRRVVTTEGEAFPYDALLLATGSRVRRLPETLDHPALHYMRTRSDAERLSSALDAGADVIVIGGGFIGLEVAATARQLDCGVTVIEALPRLMSRGMPSFVSAEMRQLHLDRGVQIVLGATITGISQRPNRKMEVALSDRTLCADVVAVGIGIIANTELAAEAGLEVANGIVVDSACRSSDPNIFAAGEVTAHPSAGSSVHRRIESWRVAFDQALIAARSMLGLAAEYQDHPWLWSDQYDTNIQTIGVLDGGARLALKNDGAGRWTLLTLTESGVALGAVAMNNGRDISMMRKYLKAGGTLPDSLMAAFQPISAEAL